MTDAVSIALITSGTTVLLFVLKDVLDKRRVKAVEAKVDIIQKDVNGHTSLLVKAVGDAKFAEGKEQQKAESETTASDVVQAIKDDPNIDITKNLKL